MPCAALTVDAGRHMHEESHTQTSDLDNNSRDEICECIFFISLQMRYNCALLPVLRLSLVSTIRTYMYVCT